MVTAGGIDELRVKMPHANVDKLASDPKVENIQDLFTDLVFKSNIVNQWNEQVIARFENRSEFTQPFDDPIFPHGNNGKKFVKYK